ncbi:MAG: hypothetical protein EPN21_13255 [Methylococcaceae bacterium]|nr:MAG: hypothetical protein EPN21_13255 [Methylococcaceae bacterium]
MTQASGKPTTKAVILRVSAVVAQGETVPPGSSIALEAAEAESLVLRGLADWPAPEDETRPDEAAP